MKSVPLFLIAGPTAVGKSELALALAKEYPFEIISVDSAQIYCDMHIGTAKPSSKTQQEIPHHLINVISPETSYSVGRFREDCLQIIEDIYARQRWPLLVGGTMLYFKALLHGLHNLPTKNQMVRQHIEIMAQQKGWEALHQYLASIDPESATRIRPTDHQRLSRALEIIKISGMTPTTYYQTSKSPLPYDYRSILLWPQNLENRATLRHIIAQRWQGMLTDGMVEEVQHLRRQYTLHKDLPSMRAVGYRQVWQYLENKIDYETLSERAIIATAQLAKRQITWLRSMARSSTIPPNHVLILDPIALSRTALRMRSQAFLNQSLKHVLF